MKSMYKKMNQKGMTLIELLVVVSIISFLLSTFFPTLFEAQAKGEDARRIASLKNLQTQIVSQTNFGELGYQNIFSDGDASRMIQRLLIDTNVAQEETSLVSDSDTYAIVFPLKTSGFWCVDYTGVSRRVTARISLEIGPYSCDLAFDSTSGPGSLDTTFTQGYITGSVSKGIIQTNDKVILVGPTEYNDVTTPGIVRINADGTLDTEFVNNITNFVNANPGFTITNVAVNPENTRLYISFDDGNIEEAGEFTQEFLMSGRNEKTLEVYGEDVSFMSDGTLVLACRYRGVCLVDPKTGTLINSFTEFGPYSESSPVYVSQVLVGGEDAIYAGGNFETYQEFTVNNFVKMDNRGSYIQSEYDDGFGFDLNLIRDIQKDESGSIYVIGYFTNFRSNPAYSYVVIDDASNSYNSEKNPGGSGSPSSVGFNSGSVNSIATGITFQDGKVVLAGNLYSFDNTPLGYILSISEGGALFSDFDINPIASGKGFNALTRVVLTQSDGKLIVAGGFTAYNGVPVGKVVRLNNE